jgi:hypothetical protein
VAWAVRLVDIEPHLIRTVEKIPDADLRPLLAGMLQRLVIVDGPAFAIQQFPLLEGHFEWPRHQNWNP